MQLAMTKLYLFQAVEKIQTKGKEAIISSAEGDEQKMLLMGSKAIYKICQLSKCDWLTRTSR